MLFEVGQWKNAHFTIPSCGKNEQIMLETKFLLKKQWAFTNVTDEMYNIAFCFTCTIYKRLDVP